MKIKSVKLHPFAGIREKEFRFDQSLNVVLGPNEAGKSTLFQAILNGLLTTSSFQAQRLLKEMGRFFPASGGDTIRVTLELEDHSEGDIQITKVWKKGNHNGKASLHLPDGTEITDEEAVQIQIEELLPVSPATMKTILLADQSGLHQTMSQMADSDGVRRELGEILRQNLMETGGVSVDQFRELLDSRYANYFKKWDRGQNYPKNNKGINNPYKAGTGKIVEAFYKKEQLRLDLGESKQFEAELDQLNEKLTGLINRQKEKKEEYEKKEPLKRGVSRRNEKEQELETAELKKKELMEIIQKWPVMEDKIENLEPKQKAEQEKIEKLEKEQAKAEKKQQVEQLKARIKKLEKLAEDVESAKKEAEEAKKVENTDVKQLRNLHSEIRRLNAQIEAARLTVKIVPKSDGSIEYVEAGKEEEEISAKPGESIDKVVSGGFTLRTKDLDVQVISGEGDLKKVIEDHRQKKGELNSFLKKLGVDTVQSAESFASLYQQKQQELKQTEKVYQSEIGDDRIDKLKELLKGFGDLKQIRSNEEINKGLVDAQTELRSLSKEAEEAKDKLDEWKERFESYEKAVDCSGDISVQIRGIKKVLEELPKLPDGFDSAAEFIENVELLAGQISELNEEITSLKFEKKDLEARAPDTSTEELKVMFEEAETNFKRIQKEGETLAKVLKRSIELLESLDSDTYKGLEKSFLKWLSSMTEDRFATIELDDDLPGQFITDDDRPLTYDLLSHGTKDSVSLAWRFALTEYFLNEGVGFIILDDSLVDMDPNRRGNAVKSIEKFSQKNQVLFLTCHPEYESRFKKEGKIIKAG